jgi:hypothetical protein
MVWPAMAAIALAAVACALVPHAMESGRLLFASDDPVEIANRAVDARLNPQVAQREIEEALAADDVDLANSFVALAADRGIAIGPDLAERVKAANAPAASTARNTKSFVRGLVIGEPSDMVGLAGTAVGDLFVFGDIRDATREGIHYARGEPVDHLVLGLAGVGLAITAGTYASLGAGTPARVGVSLIKAARKTGQLGARMASWLGRSLRGVVDLGAVRRVFAEASITRPALAERALRDAVKLDKADELVGAVRDVGEVEAKAGTRTALDSLRVAQGPKDMARFARLSKAAGGKTRAIIKLAGRAAIVLTFAAFDVASWLFTIVMALLGFLVAIRSMTERATLRYAHWRKAQRWHKRMRALAAAEREVARLAAAFATAAPGNAASPGLIRAPANSSLPELQASA